MPHGPTIYDYICRTANPAAEITALDPAALTALHAQAERYTAVIVPDEPGGVPALIIALCEREAAQRYFAAAANAETSQP